MPLDFTGYVPGIPNMGPKYVPPTTIQLIEGLQLEIKALKRIIEGLAPETEVAALTEAVNALDGQLDTLTTVTIPAINASLADKEDKSNKVTTLTNASTNTQYPGAKCVYDELTGKENTANKASDISGAGPWTNQYPSVSAVKSFMQDVSDGLENDIDDVETLATAKADGGSYDSHEELRPAKMTDAIVYGYLDATSTSTVLKASVPCLQDGLRDGLLVMLKNGVVTSASGCTLNVNNTGAKPIYSSMAAATRVTTGWNINYTMLFMYDATRDGTGGWIMYYGMDTNTNTIGYQLRTNSYSLPMTSVVYRYRLLFTSADHAHFVPATNSTSTNATTARSVCQDPIDPFGPIVYYGTTASVAAGSRPAASSLWQQYQATLGYSFAKGSALQMTLWKPVYIKAAPQADGSAIIDSTEPWVQTLPSTNDGKIYIFLGVAYSETAIELNIEHPVYYHDGTAIRLWTGPLTP